jgi:hypothetical protein
MTGTISDSRFNMWRAVVAMIHADHVIQPHEIHYILQSTRDLPMTDQQREQLRSDLSEKQDIQALFETITAPKDKADFFHFARAVAWSDGDFDEAEREAILKAGLNVHEKDRALLKDSRADFEDIYLEGRDEEEEPTFSGFIKDVLKRRKA